MLCFGVEQVSGVLVEIPQFKEIISDIQGGKNGHPSEWYRFCRRCDGLHSLVDVICKLLNIGWCGVSSGDAKRLSEDLDFDLIRHNRSFACLHFDATVYTRTPFEPFDGYEHLLQLLANDMAFLL